jgi:PAS domain S-box-containing protein
MEIKNFNKFFAGSPVPMLIIDLEDYSVKNANDEMLELYGYSREEMLSFTLFDLRGQEEVSKLKERLPQLETGKAKNEGVWKHTKKSGDPIYVRVLRSPVTFEEDGKTYQLVMYVDISKELNAHQRFEMLYENSLDGIMLTNPNGDILQANKAACEILGMSEEEIIETVGNRRVCWRAHLFA